MRLFRVFSQLCEGTQGIWKKGGLEKVIDMRQATSPSSSLAMQLSLLLAETAKDDLTRVKNVWNVFHHFLLYSFLAPSPSMNVKICVRDTLSPQAIPIW